MHSRKKGNIGEEKATHYLLNKGYKIITRNYQYRSGEIDCIAEESDGTIVFVEVKSALSMHYGHPFQKIDKYKQRKIIQTAKNYISEHKLSEQKYRFDAIAVTPIGVEHIKNAFVIT